MSTEVLVPPLGQTVDTVTLVAWHKTEGEAVTQGEMLFVIETDKATLDIEAPASGILRQVTAQPGDEVTVLSAIALIAADGEALEQALPAPDVGPVHSDAPITSPLHRATDHGPAPETTHHRFVSPRARRLAEKHEVPLAQLRPTGPEGAIVERDVRAYLDAQAVSTAPVAQRRGMESAETVPMRGVRAVIAERMRQSVTATARVTLNAEADGTELVGLRHRLAREAIDVSHNALLIFILGRALHDHPKLNASLQGDAITQWHQIHVGLAVESERGLLVPVIRDVDRKGLLQISTETQRLVERARMGQCNSEEPGGGTFTLTNLGMFGIDSFTPIINLPECAILGVGRFKRRPAMIGDQIEPRYMVWLSLTFDHRLVDGAPAARFLQRVVQLVEQPHLLLA